MNLFATFLNFLSQYGDRLLWVFFVLVLMKLTLKSLKTILKFIYKKFKLPKSYYLTVKAIIVFLIYLTAALLILLAIPGVNEKVIAIMGIGIGLLVSLSSTSTIGNAVAGLILHITRPICEGDRIELDGVIGDVVSIELLFVHLKTTKDEIVSFPALQVLNNKIINYSQLEHMILHVSVGLGYDLDPSKVQSTLIESALEVEGIDKKPAPFVLINKLRDYTVEYEINAYTKKHHSMIKLKSLLRESILINFHKKGMQIMSPMFVNTKEFPRKEVVIPKKISVKLDECLKVVDEKKVVDQIVDAKAQIEDKKKETVRIEEKKKELEKNSGSRK